MSDDYGPCRDCGRPFSEHSFDADVADEAKAREEFDHAVAVKVEEKLAFEGLVRYKLAVARDPNQTAITRPRDPDHDALEIARVHAYENAKAYQQLVQRKVQDLKAARGDAEYIQVPKGAINRRAYLASKDAPLEGFETRDLASS